MFERLFGRGKGDSSKSPGSETPGSHMPEVDQVPNIEEVFKRARKAAAGEGEQPPGPPARHVVVVTPGRMLMLNPCPPPGSMPQKQLASMEQMISPKVKRNIAAIAYTELRDVRKDISKAIPFFGLLLGFSYIGHSVWVFEGHSSALAAGCRDADVLIVDGDVIPHLQKDWVAVATAVMRKREIYMHDRATYSLRRVP